MKNYPILLLFLMTTILLASCGSGTPTPAAVEELDQTVESTPTLDEEPTQVVEHTQSTEGYPVESSPTSTPSEETLAEGYPAPDSSQNPGVQSDELTIPSPDTESGIVTGQLLSSEPDGEPLFALLYLARTMDNNEVGYPPVNAFSESENPFAKQDKTGRFLFENIEPGYYGLAILTSIASALIQDPETGDFMLIEVRAGEVIDLGMIVVP